MENGSSEKITKGMKLPNSDNGIFVTDRRLVVVNYVSWFFGGGDRNKPISLEDLNQYRIVEIANADITKLDLLAPRGFRSGSLTAVLKSGETKTIIHKIWNGENYFADLHKMLAEAYPDMVPPFVAKKSHETLKWIVTGVVGVLALSYFILAYLGVVPFY